MKQLRWISFILLFILAFSSLQAGNRNLYPLPEERGTAGTLAALEKLNVYVRVLHTTAHPDDESSGTLTWLSRKFHAQTTLYCLTRGEGGQNILGNEKYDALGIVRTGELLEACRRYGVDLKFGGTVDFGFSKTAEETLSKWGREATLEEMVRLIRRWRPAIILSRFEGTAADGHGHHQAAGILTREAFRAAADPQQFPQHLKEGLTPWQAQKLYISRFGGEFAAPGIGADRGPGDWTVRVPVGDFDPVLGRSYREIAAEGYSEHRSQGNGAYYSLPGTAFEYFKLVEATTGTKAKEDSFFDSIDTSLGAIYNLAGNEKGNIPFLPKDLDAVSRAAKSALHAFQVSAPARSAEAIASGIRILDDSILRIERSSLTVPVKQILLDALEIKRTDFHKALSSVLGLYLIAMTEDAAGVPGEKEPVTLSLFNRGAEPIALKEIKLEAPGKVSPAADNPRLGDLPPASSGKYIYAVEISQDAQATEPFWHLDEKGGARYRFRQTEDTLAPFGKPAIRAEAVYRYKNVEIPLVAIVNAPAGDPIRGADFIDFQVVPALSIALNPNLKIISNPAGPGTCTLQVSVLNNRKGKVQGILKLNTAPGWRVAPAEAAFALSRKGEAFAKSFVVTIPGETKPGDYTIEAVATMDGQEFRNGFQIISYPENWTQHLYSPAQTRIEKFPVAIAPNLTVGYIPGAGDDVPGALEQLGVSVQMLADNDLAFGDLARFPVIVTGIRAYNVNDSLRKNNQRLLDYVTQGGTLIVQYVRPMGMPSRGGSAFPFGPYPMTLSNDSRITVEDSPIRLLDRAHPIFNQPNKISDSDFQGWIQERGLYFMDTWDPRYQALLSGNDPGEGPQNGGMLYTRYGKGHYIYTGYSWFRQLPAGVPGAYRLFANMLSLTRPMP